MLVLLHLDLERTMFNYEIPAMKWLKLYANSCTRTVRVVKRRVGVADKLQPYRLVAARH